MKAKQYLMQIKRMNTQIAADIEELGAIEALATKTTSVFGDDRVQSSGSQDKMADCVVKMAELKKKINDEIVQLIDFKDEARRIVIGSCDPDCMALLNKRYFQNKKWEEIAVELNYSFKWVSGGLHQRALSQVQKGLDKEYKR